jgi:hypothetical protein
MKLSNETLAVLKNFSGINQGIEFKAGTKLRTMSVSKSVLAEAVLKDSFPEDFCVYDLNQFLSALSLFKDSADVAFDDANILFSSGRRKTKFRKTDKSMIVTPPEKDIKLGEVDCSFLLSADDYNDIMKARAVLSSPHIAVVSDGDKVELVSYDAKDDSQHTNSIDLGDGNGKQFRIVFKEENLKMIPGEYAVEISFKGFAHFKNTKEPIQYWIAFEAKESTF